MFIVIADDLTGAAELAGIGLQFGLSVEIKNEFSGSSNVDLLVINTASRILKKEDAFIQTKKATEYVAAFNPLWIFKKTDSALRGNILPEIKAILEVTGLKKSLLIPANPGLGRTIVNKEYLINNVEIAKTSFAQDPDYPCESSDVISLLGTFEKVETSYLKENEKLPISGVFIGEIKSESSIKSWAEQVNETVLAAGAAEFFTNLLQKQGYSFISEKDHLKQGYGKTMFICGSTHQNSRVAIEHAKKENARVFYIPEKLLKKMDNNFLEKWLWDIKTAFKKSDKIILAVADANVFSKDSARKIQNIFSRVIAQLLLGINLDTLAIEGGETAQEITKRLKINNFYPQELLAAGVVQLSTKVENPSTIIIKPGSYLWPEILWNFN